jgi:NADPH:quinone reductase-like Zn-dependent oxidoreductase
MTEETISMKLTWHGHSAFRIEGGAAKILIDPFLSDNPSWHKLAREAGAYVIGTGRAAHRQMALDFGAQEFVDLENDALEDVGAVDLVFDVFGGDIGKRSARLLRAGGTLVTIAGPTETRPADGLAVDFVVVSDRAQLNQIVQRVRDGRLQTNIGNIATLDNAVAALNRTERHKG